MASDVEGLKRGPRFLQVWSNAIAKAINANYKECVVRHFHGKPKTGGGPDGGQSDGDSGSDGDIETVTGAVNGVPSTLNVMTDGAGWKPI